MYREGAGTNSLDGYGEVLFVRLPSAFLNEFQEENDVCLYCWSLLLLRAKVCLLGTWIAFFRCADCYFWHAWDLDSD